MVIVSAPFMNAGLKWSGRTRTALTPTRNVNARVDPRASGEGNEVACAAGITKFIRGDGNRELVLGDTTEHSH